MTWTSLRLVDVVPKRRRRQRCCSFFDHSHPSSFTNSGGSTKRAVFTLMTTALASAILMSISFIRRDPSTTTQSAQAILPIAAAFSLSSLSSTTSVSSLLSPSTRNKGRVTRNRPTMQVVLGSLPSSEDSVSLEGEESCRRRSTKVHRPQPQPQPHPQPRRNFLVRSVLVPVLSVVATATTATTNVADAACLPGDLSPDCIGVYKVPIDDSIRGMVGTPDALRRYAPELRYVPPVASPRSLEDAVGVIQAQRRAADDIRQVVAGGRLEEAGIKVLNLIPKITTAGQVIVDDRVSNIMKQPLPQPKQPIRSVDGESNTEASSSSSTSSQMLVRELQRQQIQAALDTLVVEWNQVDIIIGQGIRGQLGVSAVAQLAVLDEIKDAVSAFDDFFAALKVVATPADEKY